MPPESRKRKRELVRNHYKFVVAVAIVVVLDVLVLTYRPIFSPWPVIETTYTLFSFSVQGTLLLYAIGGFLLHRWLATGRQNTSTLCFGIAFCVYGVLLVGLVCQALGFPWADMTDPALFFAWRHVMILWAALMYHGLARIVTKNRKIRVYPAVAIVASGYAIFVWGLLFVGDIELMMYAFLYSVWSPVCFLLVYLFWLFSKKVGISAPKIIAVGFVCLSTTYLFWAPTHGTYNYWLIYALFNVSNALILIGFVILPYQIRLLELTRARTRTSTEER